MNAIKQCYSAYEGRRGADDLNDVLADARTMLPVREYAALDSGVNDYCDALEEKAFAAGFRFAVQLLAEGMR